MSSRYAEHSVKKIEITVHDRDINAAKNILAAGRAETKRLWSLGKPADTGGTG
jgi:transposase